MGKLSSFVLCLFVTSLCAEGQVKQGTVIYERRLNMHKNLQKEDERIKNVLPEFSVSKQKLLFSGDESISSNLEEIPDIASSVGDASNNRIQIRLTQPDAEFYKNYKLGKTVELRELGPRKYIIEDSLPVYRWQLKDETRMIGKYQCKKAITKSGDNKEVVAWYTEDIPCSSGPEAWGGLPGLILELDINDGDVRYSAVEIGTELKNELVKLPSGGKKISRAAFNKMIEEERGPEERSGRVIIRSIEQ
jgi:GLPGLI family protein